MENTLTIKEAITLIQEEAFAASGMTLYDVQAFYRTEKERISRFVEDRPDYLLSREEMLHKDPSLTYIELDLPKRFDTAAPGLPYQHPYLYPWFEEILRYYNEKTGDASPLPSLIIATAPTGRFNAIALPGSEESGILIEDGLMHVANNFANELAFLLYEKVGERRFQERLPEALQELIAADDTTLHYLAQVIWQYVIEGYSFLPGPIGNTSAEDFSIRHILSTDFIVFVLKHESFHINWWRNRQTPGRDLLKGRHQHLWGLYTTHFAQALSGDPLSATEFEQIYYVHQEELLADFFAFSAVMQLGKKENTYTASVKGAWLFFQIAELIQHLLFRLEDPDFPEKLATYDGGILSLTAILSRESHPYAYLRKKNILTLVKQVYPQEYEAIAAESATMDLLTQQIKALLDDKVATAADRPFPHPKWAYGRSAML